MKIELTVESIPTERVATTAWAFAQGESYTTAQVATLTGLTWFGAYKLLCKMSRVLPIYCDHGVWKAT